MTISEFNPGLPGLFQSRNPGIETAPNPGIAGLKNVKNIRKFAQQIAIFLLLLTTGNNTNSTNWIFYLAFIHYVAPFHSPVGNSIPL